MWEFVSVALLFGAVAFYVSVWLQCIFLLNKSCGEEWKGWTIHDMKWCHPRYCCHIDFQYEWDYLWVPCNVIVSHCSYSTYISMKYERKKKCFYAKQAIDNKAIVLPVGGARQHLPFILNNTKSIHAFMCASFSPFSWGTQRCVEPPLLGLPGRH